MSKSLPAWMLPALFVAIGTFVVVAVKTGRRRDVQRSVALAGVSQELGLAFVAEDNSVLREFGGYAVKPIGNSPRATSVMRGHTIGTQIALFDYDVTLGTDSKYIVRRTVAAFPISGVPVFELEGGRQERWIRIMDKLMPGKKGIQFADDEKFSRAFTVFGADTDAVRSLLNANVRALMLQRPEWACRCTRQWLLFSWVKKRPAPSEMSSFLADATNLMRAMTAVRA